MVSVPHHYTAHCIGRRAWGEPPNTLPQPRCLCLQDAVDKGWLLTQPSHLSSKVSLKKLLLTAQELANAMAYLHGVDIMHGDLTGGNVLLHSATVTPSDPRGFITKVPNACYAPGFISVLLCHHPTQPHAQATQPSQVKSSQVKIHSVKLLNAVVINNI